MRKILKEVFYGALHAAGLTGMLLRKNRRAVPVLLYHGVTDRRWPGVLDCEKKHIGAEDFERQLVFLKKNFQVVRLSSYVAALRGGERLPEGCAVITFDDGYADNHAVAFPLLRKHGLPATLFLAADFVTQGTALWVDRLAWAFARTELGDWQDPVEGTRFSLATEAGKTACYLWVKRRLKLLPDAEREELVDRIGAALLGSHTAEPPALFAPLSRDQVRELAPDVLICLIDNIEVVHHRLHADHTSDATLKDALLVVAQGGAASVSVRHSGKTTTIGAVNTAAEFRCDGTTWFSINCTAAA